METGMDYVTECAESYRRIFESSQLDESGLVDVFIDQITGLLGINEEERKPFITKEELVDLKNRINTPEDMEKYLEENKDNIRKFFKKCEESGQSKLMKFAKYAFRVLWNIVKYGVPFVWRNRGTVMVLFLYFVVCNKLGMSPWTSAGTLFDATWKTGKTIVDAAVKINNGADAYIDTSEEIGDKVGTAIGTAVQAMKDLF